MTFSALLANVRIFRFGPFDYNVSFYLLTNHPTLLTSSPVGPREPV